MKANEAPEKIYLLPRQGGDYAPYWRTNSQDGFGIEYTRTDAFIEKASEWLRNYINPTAGTYLFDEDIEKFRKAMKGE